MLCKSQMWRYVLKKVKKPRGDVGNQIETCCGIPWRLLPFLSFATTLRWWEPFWSIQHPWRFSVLLCSIWTHSWILCCILRGTTGSREDRQMWTKALLSEILPRAITNLQYDWEYHLAAIVMTRYRHVNLTSTRLDVQYSPAESGDFTVLKTFYEQNEN